jgi:hypothetical protein
VRLAALLSHTDDIDELSTKLGRDEGSGQPVTGHGATGVEGQGRGAGEEVDEGYGEGDGEAEGDAEGDGEGGGGISG